MEIPGKLSYLSVSGKQPLFQHTLGNIINEACVKFGNKLAVIAPKGTSGEYVSKTFDELKSKIEILARGFVALGLKNGDRIGLWGPNSYEWYLCNFAGMKAGLSVVHINSAFQTDEVRYCINKVGISCLLISEKFKSSDYYKMLCEIAPDILESQPGHINSSAVSSLSSIISFTRDGLKQPGTFSLADVIEFGRNLNPSSELLKCAEAKMDQHDICNIQFTSGTTGDPKASQQSHYNIVNNSHLTGKRLGLNSDDSICIPSPLFHGFGSIVGALLALQFGCTAVFPSPGFSPSQIISSIEKHKCTVIYGTPTMHISILNELQTSNPVDRQMEIVKSLRMAVTGGAFCPESLVNRIRESSGTAEAIRSLYGMTEVSPIVSASLPSDTGPLLSTVGYPLEHLEVKIADKDGNAVPIGESGELCVRGYSLMKGYFGDEEKTKEIIDKAGWLHTGDLFRMQETGHLRIMGRIKEIIIRGGENIYPGEIEDFFLSLPGVNEVAVVGVPDEIMGEEVVAFVVPKIGELMNVDKLKSCCRGKIAHFKIPKFIYIVEILPKTASGKIKKYSLQEMAKEMLSTKKSEQ